MRSVPRFWVFFLGILALATLVFTAGNQRVGLWDRDEPRYAECSREMLRSGDWVVPMFLGGWRLEKPPLIYWCQATAMTVMGVTAEAARLPSAVGAVATGLIIGLTVRRFVGDGRALWSAFIFCTCGLAAGAAKFCNTDAVLTFFVIGGQACLAFFYNAHLRKRPSPKWAVVVFWAFTALAGLTKGPQALGMHAMTMLILLLLDVWPNWNSPSAWRKGMQWWGRLQPIAGIPILALVLAPWLILAHQRAPGFVEGLFAKAKDHVGSGMDGHGEPPGYHLLLIFGTFFPWSLILPATITMAFKHRKFPAIRFAMAVTAGPWLLMEFVYTKLPFYVLPAFGGLSFLTADTLVRCIRGQTDDMERRDFVAGVLVWSFAALALGGGPWAAALLSRDLPWHEMILFSAVAMVYVAIVCLRLWQGRLARAAVVMGVGTSCLVILLFTIILPNFDFLKLSQRIVSHLPPEAMGPRVHLAMVGYTEPSLAFLQGGGAREHFDDYLQTTPPAGWPRWIVITKSAWLDTPESLRQLLDPIAVEEGVAYAANGRHQTLLLVEKRQ